MPGKGRVAVDVGVVRQIVLKVNSRCNIACDYCYVYEHVDQGWRRQPVTMSPSTLELLGDRIGEHAARHDLRSISVVLHGGEPLLAGPDAIAGALATIRAAVPASTSVHFGVQTNGILLDDSFLELFRRYGVRVGVSLDGGAAANDRHRRYANGRGSWDRAVAGLRKLERYRDVYGGILCTIDVRNDPLETYRDLLRFAPPSMDFLLPHGNWTYPPPRPPDALPYGAWLVRIFDDWYDPAQASTRIRLFESIMSMLLGGPSTTECIGGDMPGVVVVETDGSYEQSDALKTASDGAAATGLTVAADSLDDVMAHLAAVAPSDPAPECLSCPVWRICGGGLRAHRYRNGGFANPSVYCADLLFLIRHVERRMRASFAAR